MRLRFLTIHWLALLGTVWGCTGMSCAQAAEDFLDPDQAFQVSARALGGKSIELTFKVAPGYYLYREQFRFSAAGASLGAPDLPRGKVKYDETFQKDVETYRDVLHIALPVESADRRFALVVTSQGCSDAGLCYPPRQSAFDVSLGGFGGDSSVRQVATGDVSLAGKRLRGRR